jgi:hypothetical protein
MMRKLTRQERSLIASIAEKVGGSTGRQLLTDLESARVSSETPDGARVTFDIPDYERPPYRGQHPFSVEGKMLDGDRAELSVLVHADENDRLLELEFIRWGEGDLIGPDWDTLKLH